MGLFSPLKGPQDSTVPLPKDTHVNSLEAQIVKRQARKPEVAPACRAPLQPSVKIAQEAAFRVDVAGKNGGKENIPPGAVLEVDKTSKLDHAVQPKPKRLSTVSSMSARCTTMHMKPRTTNSAVDVKKKLPKRGVLGEIQNNEDASSTSLRSERPRTESHDPLRNASASLKARASVLSERLGQSQTTRASEVKRTSTFKELNSQHPLLMEDISRPALYEDDWLSHQETVITQLVNALFECTSNDSTAADPYALRLELLEIYHTEDFTRLYQRLQSSLSYGTLAIHKDIQARNSRLKHDLGLRRQFLDTWIQTYDLRALVPALEAVMGRRISSDFTLFDVCSGSAYTDNLKAQKAVTRKVEGFLEAFLLQNDDMVHAAPGAGEIQARAYRRTALRSIVLVVLLDHARQSFDTGLPRQLFLPSSPYKSSAEVLQALARLLLPSGGDIVKSLGHLDCHVTYKQHALQEFDYMIDNIAVDFRDGVRLTKIVEILFYSSGLVRNSVEGQVTSSSVEKLSLGADERDLPLSGHLKYPCISRAAKTYNVQIALSALSSVKEGRVIIGEIRAEDIVDGYREKTIALLWALLSKWGLTGLVDWDDVRKETGRLQRKLTLQLGHDRVKQEAWFPHKNCINDEDHASLLQRWAAILAALKGLRIRNMTTSFADGKIYGSIVDEYEPFITATGTKGCDIGKGSVLMSLESRLRQLGCSPQFGKSKSLAHIESH
jgi:abnormal spindle-like microcephaly-associated protein